MLNEEQLGSLEHPDLLELLEIEDPMELEVSLVPQETRDQRDQQVPLVHLG